MLTKAEMTPPATGRFDKAVLLIPGRTAVTSSGRKRGPASGGAFQLAASGRCDSSGPAEL